MDFPGSSAGKESASNAGDPGSIPGFGRSPGKEAGSTLQYFLASMVAQMVKNTPAMQETWVWSLAWDNTLEEGMATPCSILPWRNPMVRGAWWTAVHGVAESDLTEQLSTAQCICLRCGFVGKRWMEEETGFKQSLMKWFLTENWLS